MNKIESIQASIGLTVKGSTSAEGKTAGQMFSATLANALGSTPIVAMALPPVATIQHTQFDLPLNLTAAKIWQQPSINERALGLRAYRQELLASNIANADTPGYVAVDIDVEKALKTGKSKDDVSLQFRLPAQGSIDGNTVDMDVERAQFAHNSLMYEYSVDRVKGRFKELDDLLKNTPY